ncbi:hypothetical protein J3R83DRAFT_1040 [Lanmaoa asiatica]|nr:hypothetical protein J3R83DRAFT_1040 [Lanmaoa asiatica]
MSRTIKRLLWGDVPASKQERKLLFKIDSFILSYCCLMVRALSTSAFLTDTPRFPSTLQTVCPLSYTHRSRLSIGPPALQISTEPM